MTIDMTREEIILREFKYVWVELRRDIRLQLYCIWELKKIKYLKELKMIVGIYFSILRMDLKVGCNDGP